MAVFLACLAGASLWALQTADDERLAEYAARRNRATEQALTLEERMHAYQQALLGASALFLSDQEVTRERWHAHEDHIGLTRRYPGVYGLGFVRHVPGHERERHIDAQRRDGVLNYVVRPDGVRAEYGPVVYLEPYGGRNVGVLGYDILSEPVRRDAALKARDDNRPVLTAPIELLQDDGTGTPGVMLIAPVYRRGAPLGTLEERRKASYGWAYIPFRTQELIGAVLGDADAARDVRVVVGDARNRTLLYGRPLPDSARQAQDQAARDIVSVTIELPGATWQLISSPPHTLPAASSRPALILALGALVSLLLFGLTLALTRKWNNAQRCAEDAYRFLDAIVNAIPVPLFVKDSAHRTVLSNDANCAVHGLTREAMLGKTDEQMFGAERAAVVYAQDEQALCSGKPVFYEEALTSRAGDARWSLKAKTATAMPDGSRYVVGTLVDITDRKRAELQLQRGREFLDAILAALPIPVYVKDRAHRYVLVNETFAQLFGMSVRQVLGKSDFDVLTEEVARANWNEDDRAFDGGERLQSEQKYMTTSGRSGWFIKNKMAVRVPDGNAYVVGASIDITAQKQAALQAERSRAFLDAIIDSMPQDVYVKSEDGRWVVVNDHFCRALALRREQLIGAAPEEVLPAEMAAAMRADEAAALASDTPLVREQLAQSSARKGRWLLKIKYAVRTADGVRYLVGVNIDITERKLAEQRLRNFFDLSADPLCIADVAGHMVEASPALARLLGCSDDAITGKPILDLVHPDDAQRTRAALNRLRGGAPLIDFVNRWRGSNGQWHWLQWRACAPDDNGRIYAVARDVTEARKREALIEHTHAMAQVGGWELDVASARVSWTEQTFRIHDTSPEEYIPTLETALDFYQAEDRSIIAAAVRRGMEFGEPWDLVLNLRTMTGRAIIVRAQGNVELDRGRPVRAFGSIQDVTALKAAESELRRHRDHLQELVEERTREADEARVEAVCANRAKSEFLTNMSHELRTPLHGILSFARLGVEKAKAGEQVAADKLAQYFQRIRQSGDRLLVLLDDLLDLSRLEAGKMRYEMARCAIDVIADTAIAEFSAFAAGKAISLAVERAAADTAAWGDPLRLGQVLGNLVSNAIKFSPANSRVRVILGEQVREGLNMAMITVCDEGMGIPPGELNAIFDKFVQSSKTKSGAGGTGLGLAICKRIVMDHGGAIWAENLPSGGAAFSFVVPRARIAGSVDAREQMRSS